MDFHSPRYNTFVLYLLVDFDIDILPISEINGKSSVLEVCDVYLELKQMVKVVK